MAGQFKVLPGDYRGIKLWVGHLGKKATGYAAVILMEVKGYKHPWEVGDKPPEPKKVPVAQMTGFESPEAIDIVANEFIEKVSFENTLRVLDARNT